MIAPAVRLAEQGFAVSQTLAEMLEVEKDNLGRWDSSRAVFFRDGRPCAPARSWCSATGKSLRLIAQQGPKAFYQGGIADKIVAEMARHGGLISKADLAGYKVEERAPVSGSYRGYQVVSMPPPSSGGIHIIQILNLLERYPLADYGSNSAQTIHYLAEAMKLAYADRSWATRPSSKCRKPA